MILNAGTPSKKCFFQKMWFFGDLGFPSAILVNKPQKAICLSSKMVYQHLLYLLSLWAYWHLKITQGPTRFFNGILGGCKRQTLRADYNGPKQQCEINADLHRLLGLVLTCLCLIILGFCLTRKKCVHTYFREKILQYNYPEFLSETKCLFLMYDTESLLIWKSLI